jgi:hypothetical protein
MSSLGRLSYLRNEHLYQNTSREKEEEEEQQQQEQEGEEEGLFKADALN